MLKGSLLVSVSCGLFLSLTYFSLQWVAWRVGLGFTLSRFLNLLLFSILSPVKLLNNASQFFSPSVVIFALWFFSCRVKCVCMKSS